MSEVDQVGRGFLPGAQSVDRYGHTLSPHGVSGVMVGMVPRSARVLDVGCGNGTLAEILRSERGASVVGIEPDPVRAEMARQRGVEVHCGFLDDRFPSTYGVFDVVLFADVLEHVADPFALVRLGAAHLSPGGALIVSVPNAAHWSVRWMILRGRFEYEDCGILDATHLRWFTRASLRVFLERAGLRVERLASTSGTGLDVYRRWPWSWLPSSLVWHGVVRLSRIWPTMFGCQHVARAVKSGGRAAIVD